MCCHNPCWGNQVYPWFPQERLDFWKLTSGFLQHFPQTPFLYADIFLYPFTVINLDHRLSPINPPSKSLDLRIVLGIPVTSPATTIILTWWQHGTARKSTFPRPLVTWKDWKNGNQYLLTFTFLFLSSTSYHPLSLEGGTHCLYNQ